jgi:hypothetical protein
MTPGAFDDLTCQELVGDERARTLSASARQAADAGEEPPTRVLVEGSYWDQVQAEAEYRIKLAAYTKRKARMTRMANPAQHRATIT